MRQAINKTLSDWIGNHREYNWYGVSCMLCGAQRNGSISENEVRLQIHQFRCTRACSLVAALRDFSPAGVPAVPQGLPLERDFRCASATGRSGMRSASLLCANSGPEQAQQKNGAPLFNHLVGKCE